MTLISLDMGKYKMLLEGDQIARELIRRQQPHPEGLEHLASEFERAFYLLPGFATKMCDDYKEITSTGWPDPGVVVLALGGGRVCGKVLERSSDLDIYFLVEHIEGSIDPFAWGPSVLRAEHPPFREGKKRLIQKIGENVRTFDIPVPVDLRSYGTYLDENIFLNRSHVVIGRSNQ